MKKNKNAIILIVLSIMSCGIYTIVKYLEINNYFYTSVIKLFIFLGIPLLFYLISKEGKFKNLLNIKGEKKYLKFAVLLGLATFLVIIIGYIILINQFDRDNIIENLLREGITKKTYPFVFVYIVLVNALLEELFFRGFIFLTLFRLNYKKLAYIYSSVLFALYHIVIMDSWFSIEIFILLMLGLIVAGLFLNELDRRCKNIYGGLFIHLGANLAINLIGVYMIYFI